MSVMGVSSSASIMAQQLVNLRSQLDNLQQQLSTGQKVTTYEGVSSQAQLLVGLNSQIGQIGSFQDSNSVVNARLSVAQTTLTQFDSVAQTVQSSAELSNYQPGPTGQTVDQTFATNQLDQLLNLLNTQADGRFLFSGASTNQPSVADMNTILNGTATQAGLNQMISERNQADLGANGLGRLVIPSASAAPARVIGSGAALQPDAPARMVGTTDTSSLSSAGGTLEINGQSITIAAGSNAQTIVNDVNAVSGTTNVTASLNQSNQLVLTSADANTSVDTTGTASNLQAELGIPAAPVSPTNLLTQGLSGQSLTLQVGSNAALTVNFGTAPGDVSTLAGLQTQLATLAGGTATVDPGTGNISVVATSPTDNIAVSGAGSTFGLQSALTLPSAGARVSISEDVSPSVFGFKLASASSTIANANVIGPTGTPASISVDLSQSSPNIGDTITYNFNMPDGTTQALTLTATSTVPPPSNTFLIGATPAATAANLQTALTGSVQTLAGTQLLAASTVEAANNFFDTDSGQPPMRVQGPSFATATALVAGTPSNTVAWYTGSTAPSAAARSSVTARVDGSLSVNYGVQANEQGIRSVIENVAIFAAATFSPSNPNSSAAYGALAKKVGFALNIQSGNGVQTTQNIETELANAQTSIQTATTQQQQTQVTLQDFVQGITGVSNEEVASEILTLQTQLQASLQTTAMLSKLSLVNFIPS